MGTSQAQLVNDDEMELSGAPTWCSREAYCELPSARRQGSLTADSPSEVDYTAGSHP